MQRTVCSIAIVWLIIGAFSCGCWKQQAGGTGEPDASDTDHDAIGDPAYPGSGCVVHVTTSGGPGTESTTLTYLIYKEAILDSDVGTAAAGGIVAVILANIVAIFLMRAIGKNLDA